MRKITILVLSPELEKIHMAAMLASVAAVGEVEVLVFVGMNALVYLLKEPSIPVLLGGDMGRKIQQNQSSDYRMLFRYAVTLGGARIHPCAMVMDVMGYSGEDMLDFLGEPLGLTKIIELSADSQVWTF